MGRGDCVALTGGGGKTTAILVLSRELRARGLRVLASTTTKVGSTLAAEFPVVFADGEDAAPAVARAIGRAGVAFLASGTDPSGKLVGVMPATLDALAMGSIADVILVEADGSRQKPLKAPAEHEPVVPSGATVVSFMVGADALGARLDGPLVHRPERVRSFGRGDIATPDLVASLVVSDAGGRKGVPHGAAVRPIVNKIGVSDGGAPEAVAAAVLRLAGPEVDRVLLTDLREGIFLVAQRDD